MTRLEEFQQALVDLMLDAAGELTGADVDEFLETAVSLVTAGIAGRWESASDRPGGWS